MAYAKLNITKRITINPEMSARDWRLYTDHIRAALVAQVLNIRLEKLVGATIFDKPATRAYVRGGMESIMLQRDFAEVGAADSEALGALDFFLDQIYGNEQ